MENLTRLEPVEERSRDLRDRFAPLVVAYFVRAIESLNATPRGPQLAVRRVWSPGLPELPTSPAGVPQHTWD